VKDKLLELAEEPVSVVEHAVEAQHFAVHLEELAQFVEVGRRLGHLDSEALHALGGVRISWAVLDGVQHDSFTLQPVLTRTHTHSHSITLIQLRLN